MNKQQYLVIDETDPTYVPLPRDDNGDCNFKITDESPGHRMCSLREIYDLIVADHQFKSFNAFRKAVEKTNHNCFILNKNGEVHSCRVTKLGTLQ